MIHLCEEGFRLDVITLYHGSPYDFEIIDLKRCRPYPDFGQGFYALLM